MEYQPEDDDEGFEGLAKMIINRGVCHAIAEIEESFNNGFEDVLPFIEANFKAQLGNLCAAN